MQLCIIVKTLVVSIKSCSNSKIKWKEKIHFVAWFLSGFWKKSLADRLTIKINSTEATPIRIPTIIVKRKFEKIGSLRPTIGAPVLYGL